MATDLILHAGGAEVTYDDLRAVPTPAATDTWFPVAHAEVIDTVTENLTACGMVVERARYALAKQDMRMFAVLDLSLDILPGVKVAAGVRNSLDKSYPLGFCAGSRVFVCDNLAFASELMVRRKHSRFGHRRFGGDVADTVARLGAFRDAEAGRIERMRNTPLGDTRAESLMLQGFERGIIPARSLAEVVAAWRDPVYGEDTEGADCWGLFNRVTRVLKGMAETNPHRHASLTMRLEALLCTAEGPPAANVPFGPRPVIEVGGAPVLALPAPVIVPAAGEVD